MFYAISKKYNDVVCANSVVDLDDTFLCLNAQCKAEYFLKGINSERQAHFCHKHNTPHIQGCPYDMGLTKYVNNDDIVKSSLQDIYAHSRKPIQKTQTASSKNHSSPNSQRKMYINTTKDLFYFCVSNPLDTVYENETTINDIIVDSRNLCENRQYEGVSGLRLIVGYTYYYINKGGQSFITFKTPTVSKYGNLYHLNGLVHLNPAQLSEIVKYIFGTFKKFSGHSIAVLGEWSNPTLYNVECTVNEPTNVIYKFANDINRKKRPNTY